MAVTLDRRTLERLIAAGRVRGTLSPEDLRAELPIDAMGAEDIALVLLELEEAGVVVEPEAVLLASQNADPVVPVPGLRTPPGDPPAPRTAATVEGPALARGPETVVPAQGAPGEDPDRAGATRAVILAGIGTLLVIAALLLLVGR